MLEQFTFFMKGWIFKTSTCELSNLQTLWDILLETHR